MNLFGEIRSYCMNLKDKPFIYNAGYEKGDILVFAFNSKIDNISNI